MRVPALDGRSDPNAAAIRRLVRKGFDAGCDLTGRLTEERYRLPVPESWSEVISHLLLRK